MDVYVGNILLTIEEAIKRLRISRAHLYNLWERDEGPPKIKIGRKVFIPADRLEEWIVEQII
jgi:excisionase family DNA binding protein